MIKVLENRTLITNEETQSKDWALFNEMRIKRNLACRKIQQRTLLQT